MTSMVRALEGPAGELGGLGAICEREMLENNCCRSGYMLRATKRSSLCTRMCIFIVVPLMVSIIIPLPEVLCPAEDSV